ncbi:MAG: hypothetical protein EP330_20050 [Deltaproteobacteria bacterium]|nr:MAG: hypothetical protein EP330_20050 [Deltaproteobacteria bacterium]
MRLALLLALAAAPTASADPGYVPVQGVLTDSTGARVDGTVDVTFTLYDDAASTTSLWADTLSLDVVDGAFATALGAGNIPLDLATFANFPGAHLVIQVSGDSPMAPVPLDHVPYAAWSDQAGDANTLGGMSLGDLRSEIPLTSDIETAARGVAYDTESELTSVLDAHYVYTAGTGLDLSGNSFSVNQSTIEGWATGVCLDSGAEVVTALGGQALSTTTAVDWASLTSVPTGLADGDDGFTTETQLTALLDDNYVADDGGTANNLTTTGTLATSFVRVGANNDVNPSAYDGAVIIGSSGQVNLGIDGNEIMARSASNGSSTFYVQQNGGLTDFGGPIDVAGNVAATSVSATTVTADSMTLGGLSYTFRRYRFWRSGDVISFVDYDGTTYTLNAAGSDGAEVIEVNNKIAVRNVLASSTADSELFLNIEGSTEACMLLHREDDVAKQVIYATDGGNNALLLGTATGTFRFQTVGDKGYGIANSTSYDIVCM